jgi:cyclic-di-GMP-binding protein
MPSFDITSKADMQLIDNAVNVTHKEISTRYDFKGGHVLVEFDKKNNAINLEADNEMKIEQMAEVLLSRGMRQGVDSKVFDISKDHQPSGKIIKKQVPLRNGIDRDNAKKIVGLIKESGIKVQAAIMDDIIRVTGKKIDDLQEVIALCKSNDLPLPLQFVNMKS